MCQARAARGRLTVAFTASSTTRPCRSARWSRRSGTARAPALGSRARGSILGSSRRRASTQRWRDGDCFVLPVVGAACGRVGGGGGGRGCGGGGGGVGVAGGVSGDCGVVHGAGVEAGVSAVFVAAGGGQFAEHGVHVGGGGSGGAGEWGVGGADRGEFGGGAGGDE